MNVAPLPTVGAPCHAPEPVWRAFVERYTDSVSFREELCGFRARFVRRYPTMDAWLAAPLAERIGIERDGVPSPCSRHLIHRIRPYLYFLALDGRASYDWAWIIALRRIVFGPIVAAAGLDLGTDALVVEAHALGYAPTSTREMLTWTLGRFLLHTGTRSVDALGDADLAGALEAWWRFGERTDLLRFYPTRGDYEVALHTATTTLHALTAVLYERGQIDTAPGTLRRPRPGRATAPPRIEVTCQRYLAQRAVAQAPGTVRLDRNALAHFLHWLATAHPLVETLAVVTREDVHAFAQGLLEQRSAQGRPLARATVNGILRRVATFLREIATWGEDDCPRQPLLAYGDIPRPPLCVPRYIPDDQLDRLMAAIRTVPCPYQRGALLIARWSGARREEIRRLEVDCLDTYPGGVSRLRIPAGKTRQERLVPLTEEAADAIRTLQALPRHGSRGLRDRLTGQETHYLFLHRTQLFSNTYLFDDPLEQACRAAGLLSPDGKPLVTAHRFRHTVATQLARKGARLHTIQKVLGHTSVAHTQVYATITDRDVLDDYLSALGPGAPIAGPAAHVLRAHALSTREVAWLHTNYYKNELELGHCLRLPEEGPCECDLFFSCPKFFTTRAKAPRWRARRRLEERLAGDARERGWGAEVRRHERLAALCTTFLEQLGEPLDGLEARE